jgi:transcriptional regulator of acetoin/glycerol metabolism
MIAVTDLPPKVLNSMSREMQTIEKHVLCCENDYTINPAELNLIINTLKKASGNVSKVARSLNIPKRTLYRKIKKYGIEVEIYRKI